jgi:hypothetical protein
LAEAQLVVSQLAYHAPEAAPSDMLRTRLLQTVRAEAAAATAKPKSAQGRRPSRSTIPVWVWCAVAATLLFAFYNVREARLLQERVREMQATLTQQSQQRQAESQELAQAAREALILTDPNSVKIPMRAGKKDLPVLQAAWHAELGIVVSGQKLPMPAGNRTLQLWLIPKAPGGKPIPSLAVRPDADGKFNLLVATPPDSASATKALAVTEEPEGGSLQPTTTPIWVGAVAGK